MTGQGENARSLMSLISGVFCLVDLVSHLLLLVVNVKLLN